MKLEEEIKQKKFRNEHHKMLVNILFTNSWLNGLHHQMLKPFDISMQQYNLLRILRGQYPKPASVNLLIDRMIDKQSTASRLVEKLRLKELVERRMCESDRRRVDVAITQKGLDVLAQIDIDMKIVDQTTENITESEAKELNRILDKLRG